MMKTVIAKVKVTPTPDNLARVIDLENFISISQGKTPTPKADKSIKVLVDEETLASHSADPIENEKDINDMIRYLYLNGNYASMCLFILGINTGYRPVDLVNIRKCDVISPDGKLKDKIGFVEVKTGKVAVMFLNRVVKAMFLWLFSQKKIGYYDYVFVSEGNRKGYLYFNEKENKMLSHPSENSIKIAKPIHHNTVSAHFIKAADELGITGHFSSYCMRQTFSYHFRKSASKIDGNSQMGLQQVTLLSHYFNHSSLNVTQQHYVREKKAMQEIVLNMNLGEEALIEIVNEK